MVSWGNTEDHCARAVPRRPSYSARTSMLHALLDLLIEHCIGVRKHTLEVLAVDADVFADLEGDA